jgi:hypothetical protein
MMRSSNLKPGKPLARKTPMARGTSQLRTKAPMSRGSGFKTPTAGAGLLRVAAVQAKTSFPRNRESKPPKLPKPMRSRGMKGRPPIAEEVRFMDRMGQLPCIACLKDGWENHEISLHHIDGRTKPGAHFLVLPICAGHHQSGTGENPSLIAVHPDKERFEARYGTQRELLAECVAKLREQGVLECEL